MTKAAVCPYRRFESYLAELCELFGGPDGKLPRDLPLFPTREGKVPFKEAVVVALEVASAASGMLTIDTNGKRVLGRHSFRVTGSRHWSRLGMELLKLQLFARWGSTTILRYVKEAPLSLLTSEY